MDSAAKLLLPGIDYFQVVFTMPDKLSSLALGNRREIFDLLFRSAWHALKQVIEDEQQFEAAASMILHLWNQHLESHIHLHAFVPSGGPSLTVGRPTADASCRSECSDESSLKVAGEWKTARPPVHLRQDRLWLVDADELRLAFRTEFLKGLHSLHRRDKLKLTGEWRISTSDGGSSKSGWNHWKRKRGSRLSRHRRNILLRNMCCVIWPVI